MYAYIKKKEPRKPNHLHYRQRLTQSTICYVFFFQIYIHVCVYIHKLSKNTVNSPAECHPTEKQGSSTQEVAC